MARYARPVSHTIPARHLLLALAIVAVWGTNFTVIRIALDDLPALTLAVLRFSLAFAPACLFIRRPAVPVRELAAYGLFIGLGQFGLLYIAMEGDISPGLASLVLQMQVFFTIGLSMLLSGERLVGYQWAALSLAVAGIVLIATRTDGATTVAGLGMALGAAASWGCGNIVSRRASGVNMLAYVVWSSAFAVPPLVVLTLLFDGPTTVWQSVVAADAPTWVAVGWQSVGNSLFGYGAWAWLLARHPAAAITPMALLVPVFGMAAAAVWLDEPLPAWKLEAAALVMAGLALNVVVPRIVGRARSRATALSEQPELAVAAVPEE